MVKTKSDIFIVCGERSGDLHGSHLVKKLLSKNPNLNIHCWGGELMRNSGATLLQDYKAYSTMGFIEVLSKLRFFYRKLQLCKEHILHYKPKIILLIDFPGFNLRIAKFSKNNGFNVHYFIAPKAWAWDNNRASTLSKYVDKVYSILPFEINFFKNYKCNIKYVGNPLTSYINIDYKKEKGIKKVISLLPGSRESELKHSIPIFRDIIIELKDYQFLICGVDNINKDFYSCFENLDNVTLFFGKTYEAVSKSDLSVVMSGTASLEVSLLNIPHCVVYKTSYFSYLIGRMLIKTKYISLVNLILDNNIVNEFIQGNFNKHNIITEINKLYEKENRQWIFNEYSKIRKKIGKKNTAEEVSDSLLKNL